MRTTHGATRSAAAFRARSAASLASWPRAVADRAMTRRSVARGAWRVARGDVVGRVMLVTPQADSSRATHHAPRATSNSLLRHLRQLQVDGRQLVAAADLQLHDG